MRFKERDKKDILVVACKKCKYWTDDRSFTYLVEQEREPTCPNCNSSKLECPHSGELLRTGYLLCHWCGERVVEPNAKKAWALVDSWIQKKEGRHNVKGIHHS